MLEDIPMRLMLAVVAVASIAAGPGFAQATLPAPNSEVAAPPPEPTPAAGAKTEEQLSAKPTPEGQKEDIKGTETGWSGQWKSPEDSQSQSGRNEAEGQSVKQPEQGK
jgi:hypothetical protein